MITLTDVLRPQKLMQEEAALAKRAPPRYLSAHCVAWIQRHHREFTPKEAGELLGEAPNTLRKRAELMNCRFKESQPRQRKSK